MNAGIVYLATKGSDSNSSETLNLTRKELEFLKQLLDLYFRTFDWKRQSPFEDLTDRFPGCSIVSIPDQLLRKVEKALEEK